MSIIYFCLNKAIFPVVLKFATFLFSFNIASASSCESNSENNFNVVVLFNDSNLGSSCESIPFSVSSDIKIAGCSESRTRKVIQEELELKKEMKNELLKRLSSFVPYPRHSKLLESHIFKHVKNVLYPDYVKRKTENPEYKYIVLFPESVKTAQFNEQGGKVSLMTYSLSSDIAKDSIISANLWLFAKNEGMGFLIQEVEKYEFNAKVKGVIANPISIWKKKWYTASVTSTVKTWFLQRGNTIQMSCDRCYDHITPDGLPPFIALEMKTSYKYADVIPSRNETNWVVKISEICRRPITIDFKSIGWSGWIVYPERFNTSYCKGSCMSNFDKSYCRNPISIKEESNVYRYDWKTPPNICCVPIRYSTLEIGYMISPFIAVFTTLPNMTLEECGCSWNPDPDEV